MSQNNKSNNYQYNSCVSKGICSINPKTYALQAVLIEFLKNIAKYSLEIFKHKEINSNTKNILLNILPLAISNAELDETSFIIALNDLKKCLFDLIKLYNSTCTETAFVENILGLDVFSKTTDLIKSIKFGEILINDFQKSFSLEIRDLHKLILIILKSVSINLSDIESFDETFDDAYIIILQALNHLLKKDIQINDLKYFMNNLAKTDCLMMLKLRRIQENTYGKQEKTTVSFSTYPSKAALVVGNNIKELDRVLEALKNTDIDIYTHDDMMIALTFPFFKQNMQLKGQYGQGTENCLIDFATFPGPIILTKNSLHNIENLYRGRLFTTDYACPKGVIKINNNNFEEVIQSAQNAKGFKRGKQCESIDTGESFENIIACIDEKLNNNSYDKILIIGLEKNSETQKKYFEKLIKYAPENFLIISFFYSQNRPNCLNFQTCYDSFMILKVFEKIKNFDIKICAFLPSCDRYTISQIIYLASNGVKVFVGNCAPIMLNPTFINSLNKIYKINSLSSPREDIEKIIK